MAEKLRPANAKEAASSDLQLRSGQGDADGLPDGGPTKMPTYGDMKYEDGKGPYANVEMTGGTAAGLSGTRYADSGRAPALFNDPDSAPAPSKHQPDR